MIMGLFTEGLIIYKRELLIFRANLRANLARSIIFPLVIIVFFGNIGSSIRNTPIAVVNYANNVEATQFISLLQTNQVLRIVSVTNEQTALSLLQQGSVQLVVIISPNFPSTSPNTPGVQVYYSNTQPTVIASVLPQISTYASHFNHATISTIPALASPSASGSASGASSQVATNSLYSAKGNYIDFLTGGLIGMVVVFGSLFGGGISYLSDKQLGNIKAFLITPINKNAIVIGKILSGATQSIIFMSLALLIGSAFGVTIAMGLPGIVYIMLVVIVLGVGFSALAMTIAARVKRVEVYAIFAQAVGLPLWFISGGIVPASSLPGWMQPLTAFDPLTYSSEIARGAILQGFIPASQAIADFGILLVFAAIMVAVSFRIFKSTIE